MTAAASGATGVEMRERFSSLEQRTINSEERSEAMTDALTDANRLDRLMKAHARVLAHLRDVLEDAHDAVFGLPAWAVEDLDAVLRGFGLRTTVVKSGETAAAGEPEWRKTVTRALERVDDQVQRASEAFPVRVCQSCGARTTSTSTLDQCIKCGDYDGLRPRHFLTRDKAEEPRPAEALRFCPQCRLCVPENAPCPHCAAQYTVDEILKESAPKATYAIPLGLAERPRPNEARKSLECPITGDIHDNSVTWHCPDCEREHGPRTDKAETNVVITGEPVVWADEASPFTGPQVLSLLRENEELRRRCSAKAVTLAEQRVEWQRRFDAGERLCVGCGKATADTYGGFCATCDAAEPPDDVEPGVGPTTEEVARLDRAMAIARRIASDAELLCADDRAALSCVLAALVAETVARSVAEHRSETARPDEVALLRAAVDAARPFATCEGWCRTCVQAGEPCAARVLKNAIAEIAAMREGCASVHHRMFEKYGACTSCGAVPALDEKTVAEEPRT